MRFRSSETTAPAQLRLFLSEAPPARSAFLRIFKKYVFVCKHWLRYSPFPSLTGRVLTVFSSVCTIFLSLCTTCTSSIVFFYVDKSSTIFLIWSFTVILLSSFLNLRANSMLPFCTVDADILPRAGDSQA